MSAPPPTPPPPPPLEHAVGEGVAENEGVALPLREPLPEPVPLREGGAEGDAAPLEVALPLITVVPLLVTVGVPESLGAAPVAEGAGGRDCVGVGVSAAEAEGGTLAVGEIDGLPLADAGPVAEALSEGDAEGLPEALPLPLVVPPAPTLPVGDDDAEGDPEELSMAASDAVAEGVVEGGAEGEGDGEPPLVAVGLCVAVPWGEEVAVFGGERVAVGEAEGQIVAVGGCEGLTVALLLLQPVFEGDIGALPLADDDPEPGAPPVPEAAPLKVALCEGLFVGGGEGVPLTAGDGETPREVDTDSDGGSVAERPPVADTELEASSAVGEAEVVPEREGLPLLLPLTTGEEEGEGVRVPGGERVPEALALTQLDADAVGLLVTQPLRGGEALGVALAQPLADRVRGSVGDTE